VAVAESLKVVLSPAWAEIEQLKLIQARLAAIQRKLDRGRPAEGESFEHQMGFNQGQKAYHRFLFVELPRLLQQELREASGEGPTYEYVGAGSPSSDDNSITLPSR
jgi:hypothetical protein